MLTVFTLISVARSEFDENRARRENKNINKPYHVDTFRKGKIERNTIKQLSDRLEALTKSYGSKTHKIAKKVDFSDF